MQVAIEEDQVDESLGSGVLLLFRITGDSIILTLLLLWNRVGGNGINHANKLSPNQNIDVPKLFGQTSSYAFSLCVLSNQIPVSKIKCTKHITKYHR